MEARFLPALALSAFLICTVPAVTHGASSRTANFIIEAPTPELADEIGKQAEQRAASMQGAEHFDPNRFGAGGLGEAQR